MKFHLVSLGCPKNLVDSEGVAADLHRLGWTYTDQPQAADLLFVNTCGFIQEAKEESLAMIMKMLEWKQEKPQLKVCAFGCLVKRYHEEIARDIPELDHLFDFHSLPHLREWLHQAFPSLSRQRGRIPHEQTSTERERTHRLFTAPHVGYLKISEGCSNRCTYCAIPGIRGDFRSKPLDAVLADATHLVETGAREIIVVAQDTTRYGTDLPGSNHLPELLQKLSNLPRVRWIRLQYLHPARLSEPVIEQLFSIPKVLPYFDIPFQHVADELLERMNRGVTQDHLENLVRVIRRLFPESVLRSTFIVGFPGETQTHFEQLLEFIEDLPFDRIGAFPYSPEDGTPASRLRPRVPKKVARERLDELMTLQQMLINERNQSWVGKTLEVIVDRLEEGRAHGRTFGDAPEVDNEVHFDVSKRVAPGDFLRVKLTSADAYDFEGELIA
ncbi:MAG TPA: 30S ribosomal protein S12 methylthiotransferase RimO [Candidatus Ozemobacteraceae bacterium]|nr:30S ribosomal protein S12 methylthiotransferase RimO [Candidatus Ozemobacteraceae bacterium]